LFEVKINGKTLNGGTSISEADLSASFILRPTAMWTIRITMITEEGLTKSSSF
jgi:hypothetical protein